MRECTLEQACRNQSHFLFSVKNERSVVFEWRLVCDNEAMRLLIPLILLGGTFHTGFVLGSLLFAKAGEVLGRKKTLTWGLVASCVCEFILFCSASAYFFSVALLLVGVTLPAAIIMPPLLLTEMMDSRHRASFYFYLQLFAFLGALCTSVLSYVMYTWRPMALGSMAVGLLALILVQRIKESPRYYAANLSRYQKARAIFQRIASTNRESMFEGTLVGEQMNEYIETHNEKSELPDQTADRSEILEVSAQHPVSYIGAESVKDREKELERGQRCGFIHLCVYSSCRSKSMRLFLISFCIGLTYSFDYYQAPFHPSPYFSLILHAGLSLCLLLILLCMATFLGRKLTSMVLAVVVIAGTGVIGGYAGLTAEAGKVLYLSVRLASEGLGMVVTLWGMELVPTPVRSLVTGTCFGLAVAGAMLIPVVGSGGKQGILAVTASSFLCFLLLCTLSETKTKPLQDFIEELTDSAAPQPPVPPRQDHNFSPFNEAQD